MRLRISAGMRIRSVSTSLTPATTFVDDSSWEMCLRADAVLLNGLAQHVACDIIDTGLAYRHPTRTLWYQREDVGLSCVFD